MSSVDNRIVEMQFNNKRFEQNARESMSTLDKLKEKLSFKKETKEMTDFQNVADSFNLSHIAAALDAIGDKFTLMGNLGQQAMQRIANAAISAGTSLVKSISVDQISAGMQKYEQETNTVQALYAALKPKGKSLEDVYDVLDKLAEYSDETSYSYTQMADGVSKFVAAGQDVDRSEVVMEGIANAAALAGVSIQDAGIAFRNFSDAMGKGAFQLMDWKSLQNIHMDTEAFKTEVLETAAELGKIEKDANGAFWIKTTGKRKKQKKEEITAANFGEYLRYDFFDRDVIMKTMEKYADRTTELGDTAFKAAQQAKTFTDVIDAVKDSVSTQWKASFRIIFGDLNEAIELFTPMANAIIEFTASIGEFRNEVLGKWKDAGGRDSMIGVMKDLWDTFIWFSEQFKFAVFDVFKPSYEEMQELGALDFGDYLGKRLAKATEGIKNATQAFKDWLQAINPATGNKRIGDIRRIFDGILSVVNFVKMVIGGVFSFIGDIWDQLKPTFDELLSFFGMIGDDLLGLNNDLKKQNGFTELAKNLAAIFKPLTSRLPKVIQKVKEFYNRIKLFWNTNERFVKFRESVKRVFDTFIKFIPQAIDSLIEFGKRIIETVKNSDEWKKIKEAYDKYIKPLVRLIEVAATAFNNALGDFFSMDTSDEKTLWGKLKKRFSAFKDLGPYLYNIWTELKRNFPILAQVEDWWNTSDVAQAIKKWWEAITTAIDTFLSTDTSDETSIVGKIKKRFSAMWDAVGPFLEEEWAKAKEKMPFLQQIEDFLSNLFGWGKPAEDGAKEGEDAAQETEKTVGIFEQVWGKIQDFASKIDIGKLAPLVGAIAALIWIYKKVKTLFGWASLGEAITDTVEEIGSTFTQVKKLIKKQNMESNIRSMLGIAASIWLLGDTLVKVSKLSWEEIARGLAAMAGLFVEEGAFMVIMGAFSKNEKLGKGVKPLSMIGMAVAMLILGNALKNVSELQWDEIGRGLTAMAGLFVEAGAFTILVNRFGSVSLFKKRGESALSLIGMALAMKILGGALKDLADMTWEEIGRGLTAMGGLFLEAGAFTILVNRFGSVSILSKKGGSSSGLISMANSMKTLANVLKDLADMTWEEIGRGLTAMGGLFLEAGAFTILVNRLGSTSIFQKKGITAIGMIGLAQGISMLGDVLIKLGNTDWDVIGRGLTAMAGIFVEEGAFMAIIGFMSKKGFNTNAVNFTTGILTGAIAKLGEALIELGKLSLKEILKGSIALTAIEILLGVFIAVMSNVEKIKVSNGIGMAAMAGAIWILAQAFVPLAKLSSKEIIKGIIGMAACMIALGLFCKAMENVKMSIKTILGTVVSAIALAALMIAFAFALTLIKDVDPVLVIAFGAAMILVAGAMAALAQALKVTSQMSLAAAIKGAAIIAVSAVLIGAAIALVVALAGNALEGLGGNIAMIGSYLSLYSEMVEGINYEAIQQSIQALKDIAAALVEVGLKDYGDLATFRDNFIRLGADIKSYYMNISATDLTKITTSGDVLKSLAEQFAEIGTKNYGDIATFRTNLTRMGGSMKLFHDNTADLDVEKMKTAAAALKDIGGNLSGFPEVTDISTSLANIGGAIKLYSESVKGADLSNTPDATAIQMVFEAIKGAIPSNEDMTDVAAYGTEENGSNLTLFSVGLTNLGTAVSSFSESVKGMDFTQVDHAVEALQSISKLNTTLSTTTITQFGPFSQQVTEQKEPLSNLAEDITVLGTALKSFGKSMSTVSTRSLKQGTSVLESFAGLSDKLGTSKTFVSNFGPFSKEVTEQKASLSTFSEDIILLGTSLEAFGANISKVKVEDLKSGAGVLGELADLNKKLPKTGGLSQWLTGSVSLANFAAQLKLLGAGAKDFNDSLFGGEHEFDDAKMKAAGDALAVLADVNKKLPKTGGISSWFSGKEDLSGFGRSLKDLGEGVKGFSEGLGDTKVTDEITSAVKFISNLADVQTRLSGTDSWYTLGSLAMDMVAVSSNLVTANNTLTDVTWADTSKFNELLNMASDIQVKLGNTEYKKTLRSLGEDLKGFYETIYSFNTSFMNDDNGKLNKVTESVKGIFETLNTFLTGTEASGDYTKAGESIITSIADGIGSEDSKATVIDKTTSILQRIIKVINPANRQNFINTGTWIPAGLAEGVLQNAAAVVNAVSTVMLRALGAGRRALGINSPSKEFAKIGMYSDQGLAQGLVDHATVVEEAGKRVSESALGTVLSSLMDISNLPLDDIDVQPRIRPVLDTGDISKRAGMIDSILGGNRTIGFNTRKLEAQAQILSDNTAPDIGTLTQRVTDLGSKLDELAVSITNMKIVMSNGALVGEIAPDMDRALGARARRAERGN